MKSKNVTVFVLGILFLVILLQNTQVVVINLLFWKISMSQVVLLPIVLVIGLAIGFIVARLTK
ncbi:MAG: LapA family protein [Candidatus Omnitrophota bacterium]